MAFLLLSSAVTTGAQAAPPAKARTIHWVVAHSRGESEYSGLMKDFARRVEKKSGGELKVSFTDSEANEDAVAGAALREVMDGKADLSQINTLALAPMAAVQLPYVFRSHEHAEAVFDGPVGAKMLDEVSASAEHKLKGLAFTYSGGYRVLIGKAAIRSAADVKGLRIKGGSPIVSDFVKELGGVAANDSDFESGKLDLAEVELSRVGAYLKAKPELLKRTKFVNLTRHRMLVTAIVANEAFLAGLTEEQRRLLQDEIQALALAERRLSMSLEDRNLQFLAKNGKEIVEIPEAARADFEKAGETVCAKFPELAGRIADIRAVKAKPAGRLAAAP